MGIGHGIDGGALQHGGLFLAKAIGIGRSDLRTAAGVFALAAAFSGLELRLHRG